MTSHRGPGPGRTPADEIREERKRSELAMGGRRGHRGAVKVRVSLDALRGIVEGVLGGLRRLLP